MYAVFSKVRIRSGQLDQAIEILDNVLVPATKALPGFVDAIWFGNGEVGHGVCVFDTEDQARAMTKLEIPPDSPQELEFVEVYEVHGRA